MGEALAPSLASLLVTVAGTIIAHYAIKWLERHSNRR